MVKDVGPKPLHGYHKKKPQKNIQQFASELEKAVNAGLPSNTRPYDGVFALATHWSNDKMGVAPLEDDLCRGFDTVYDYTVEKYLIEAMPSQYDTRKTTINRAIYSSLFTLDTLRMSILVVNTRSRKSSLLESPWHFY